jgi:putative flippase GtrA
MSTIAATTVTRRARLREIAAFAAVGVINTGLDFATLNILIALTHRDSGLALVGFDVVAFSVGLASSYFLNMRVTFRSRAASRNAAWLFIAVCLGGLIINATLVALLRPALGHALAPALAINVAKLVATGASLVWNYVALRRWVFLEGRDAITTHR